MHARSTACWICTVHVHVHAACKRRQCIQVAPTGGRQGSWRMAFVFSSWPRCGRCTAAGAALAPFLNQQHTRADLCTHATHAQTHQRPQTDPLRRPGLSGPTLGRVWRRHVQVCPRPTRASHRADKSHCRTAGRRGGEPDTATPRAAVAVSSCRCPSKRQRERAFLDVLEVTRVSVTYTPPPRGVRGYIYVGQGATYTVPLTPAQWLAVRLKMHVTAASPRAAVPTVACFTVCNRRPECCAVHLGWRRKLTSGKAGYPVLVRADVSQVT